MLGALFAVLAAVVIAVLVLSAGSSGLSGREGDVARAFEAAQPCGSRFAVDEAVPRPGAPWNAAHGRHYGRCEPWQPGDHSVTWFAFASAEDRARASETIGDEVFPYCNTATEIFFVDLETEHQIGAFCRAVGASEPVGKPLT